MLRLLWLTALLFTCAFANYMYNDNQYSTLNINKFFTIQRNFHEIEKALYHKKGLKHEANEVEQDLKEISKVVQYLFDTTKALSSPCREGIYREGRCANYIRADKYQGTQSEAENLCHAHFGQFAVESIIDYSDLPNGHHNYGSNGHNSYGPGGDHNGYNGDHYGSDGDHHGSDGDHHGPDGDYHGSDGDHHGSDGDHHGSDGYDVDEVDYTPRRSKIPRSYRHVLPQPEAVVYYVCYENPTINIPKMIYSPDTPSEETDPLSNPSNNIWFASEIDPKYDEDACPASTYNGKVIGDLCYTLYRKPLPWDEALNYCLNSGGSLCEPTATIAQSTLFYANLKSSFPSDIALIEVDADPNPANPALAEIWIGYKQTSPGAMPFKSQISTTVSVPYNNILFHSQITPSSTPALAAAIVQTGTTWNGVNPTTKLPYCCQYHLV